MDTRLTLAWLHLVALAIGLGGIFSRARALRNLRRDPEDVGILRRAFTGDTWWGLAAVLWLVTGLWRLIAGTEKATGYYIGSHPFRIKMTLFVAILALEVWPMRTLVRWRRWQSRPTARDAGRIEAISYLQCVLVVVMVLFASAMARGYGTGVASTVTASPTAVTATAAAAADPTPMLPSGNDVVTPADLALLGGEIAMPLEGVDAATLHSSFDDARGGGSRRHQALDIMAPRGTPVKSAAAGRVLKLFTSAAGGLMVYAADSSERWVLMYAHLDGYAPGLHDGATLTRGQLIGYVGSTGNASPTAPHLHFATARSADVRRWSRGRPVDPLPLLVAARR